MSKNSIFFQSLRFNLFFKIRCVELTKDYVYFKNSQLLETYEENFDKSRNFNTFLLHKMTFVKVKFLNFKVKIVVCGLIIQYF